MASWDEFPLAQPAAQSSWDAFPLAAEPNADRGYAAQIGDALSIGLSQVNSGTRATWNAATGDNVDLAANLADYGAAALAQQNLETPEDRALSAAFAKNAQELNDAKGFFPSVAAASGYVGSALEHPGAAVKQAVQSAPNALISLGTQVLGRGLGAAAGGLAGIETGPGAIVTGLVGYFGGGVAANTLMESGPAIFDILNEKTGGRAASMTAPEIEAALRADPTIATEGLLRGAKRGATIGVVEGLGQYGAGRLVGAAERASVRAVEKTLVDQGVDLANKAAVQAALETPAIREAASVAAKAAEAGFSNAGTAARWAGASTIETGASGLGEAGAQVAAGQDLDTTGIFQEMMGDAVMSPAATAVGKSVALAGSGVDMLRGTNQPLPAIVDEVGADLTQAELPPPVKLATEVAQAAAPVAPASSAALMQVTAMYAEQSQAPVVQQEAVQDEIVQPIEEVVPTPAVEAEVLADAPLFPAAPPIARATTEEMARDAAGVLSGEIAPNAQPAALLPPAEQLIEAAPPEMPSFASYLRERVPADKWSDADIQAGEAYAQSGGDFSAISGLSRVKQRALTRMLQEFSPEIRTAQEMAEAEADAAFRARNKERPDSPTLADELAQLQALPINIESASISPEGETPKAGPTPREPSIPKAEAYRILAERLGLTNFSNIVLGNYAPLSNGTVLKGFVSQNSDKIYLNMGSIHDADTLVDVFNEEAVHLVYRDPQVAKEWARLKELASDEQLEQLRRKFDRLGYKDSVWDEEAFDEIARTKGLEWLDTPAWKRFWESVKAAVRRLFGLTDTTEINRVGAQILSYALRNQQQMAADAVDFAEARGESPIRMAVGGLDEQLSQASQALKRKAQVSTESVRSAYTLATQGKSSRSVSLKELYNRVKESNPEVTPTQFIAQIQAMDQSGDALLEVFDNPQQLQEAGEFQLKNASGIPAVSVILPMSDTEARFALEEPTPEEKPRAKVMLDPVLAAREASANYPSTDVSPSPETSQTSQGRFQSPKEGADQYDPIAASDAQAKVDAWLAGKPLEEAYQELRGTMPDDMRPGSPYFNAALVTVMEKIKGAFDATQSADVKEELQAMADRLGRMYAQEGTAEGRALQSRIVSNARLTPMKGWLAVLKVLEDRQESLIKNRFRGDPAAEFEKVNEIAKPEAGEVVASMLDEDQSVAINEAETDAAIESANDTMAREEFERILAEVREEYVQTLEKANAEALRAWEVSQRLNAKKASRTKAVESSKARVEEAWARIRKREGQTNLPLFFINPANLADYGSIVAEYIYQGVTKISELKDIIIQDFGPESEPHVQELITEGISQHNLRMEQEGVAVPKAAKTAKDKAPAKPRTKSVKTLMRQQSEAGVNNYEEAVQNVAQALSLTSAEVKAQLAGKPPSAEVLANREQRRKESAERYASRLIYRTEERFRQGSKDLDDGAGGDTINRAFREQVVSPLQQDEFRARLAKLKVGPEVADRLALTAEREATDQQAMLLFKESQKVADAKESILSKASPKLAKMVNELRKKIAPGMTWADIFADLPDKQKSRQLSIYDRLLKDERLQGLTPEERLDLTNELNRVWQVERRKVFNRELSKFGILGEKSEEDTKKIKAAIPRLMRQLNLGLFNSEMFRQAMAEQYGLRSMTSAESQELQRLGQEAWNLPEGSIQRRRALQAMLDKMQTLTGASKWELLNNYWVASVLSGLRTQFDTHMAFLNGAATIARLAPQLALRGKRGTATMISEYFKGLGEAAREASRIILDGDFSYLKRNEESVMAAIDGDTAIRATPISERMLSQGNWWHKYPALVMSIVSRSMSAADHLNNTATSRGAMVYARAMNPDFYKGALTPSPQERADARKQAILELFAGVEPRTSKEKADTTARTREILNQAEAPETLEEGNQIGDIASYQNDPTGLFGGFYELLKGMSQSLERRATDFSQDDEVSKTWRAIAAFAAVTFRSLIGTRFARFATNFASNGTSFIPGTYLAKTPLYGRNLTKSRDSLILANNLIGAMTILAVVSKFGDEGDDDDLWIDGTWAGLPYAKQAELRTSGHEPLSIGWRGKDGKVHRISYRQWEIGSILASAGAWLDKRKYMPDKFKEEGLPGHILASVANGAAYVKDLSALSTFTDLLGVGAGTAQDKGADFAKKINKVAANFAGGFIPNTLKDVDAYTDPKVYKPDSAMEVWFRGVPMVRRTVAGGRPMLNLLGDPVELDRSPWSRVYTDTDQGSGYDELAKLQNRGIWMPTPSMTRIVKRSNGEKATIESLGQDVEYKYQKSVGKKYRAYLIENGPDFAKMTDEEVEKAINRDTERIRIEASDELVDQLKL